MAEPRKDYETGYPRARYWAHLRDARLKHRELARVLLERAQDGYVNPTGGKTTGRERKDA